MSLTTNKLQPMNTGLPDDGLPPFDPLCLDRYIRRTVIKFRLLGLPTFTSCQGGEGHSFNVPTIGLLLRHSEVPRIQTLLDQLGLKDVKILKKKSNNIHWKLVYASSTDGEYLWLQGHALSNDRKNTARPGFQPR